MKAIITIIAAITLSSCGQIQRIMDGTENLPNQIQETNNGMAKTNEAIRKQKIGEAIKIMLDKNNRKAIFPIPSDMMAAAKTMGEALTANESILFVKNYLIKINNYQAQDVNPPSEPSLVDVQVPEMPVAPTEPARGEDGKVDPAALADYQYQSTVYLNKMAEYNLKVQINAENNRKIEDYQSKYSQYEKAVEGFVMDKSADLYMLMMVSGFLPDTTVAELVKQEADQGAYRDVIYQILKMRVDFYKQIMLDAGMLDGEANKLDTIGKVEKAIEYAEKLDYVCKLNFTDLISLKITGFPDKSQNENLSKPLDKDTALNTWMKIQKKAMDDFKAQSFDKDPAKKEQSEKEYAAKHKKALDLIQKKIDAYSKK